MNAVNKLRLVRSITLNRLNWKSEKKNNTYVFVIKYRSCQTAEKENYTENYTMNKVKIQTEKFIIKILKHIKAIKHSITRGKRLHHSFFCKHII